MPEICINCLAVIDKNALHEFDHNISLQGLHGAAAYSISRCQIESKQR